LLQGFSAVPPLVTDIDLSLDDRFLYVACWGLGEMHQYDVTDPMNPETGRKSRDWAALRQGAKHPNGKEFAFGPQMVEISRDGKRVYWTNSLYSSWDDQFYPDALTVGRWLWPMWEKTGVLNWTRISTLNSPKGASSPPDQAGRRGLLNRQFLLSLGLITWMI
jgi:hypothetical protein